MWKREFSCCKFIFKTYRCWRVTYLNTKWNANFYSYQLPTLSSNLKDFITLILDESTTYKFLEMAKKKRVHFHKRIVKIMDIKNNKLSNTLQFWFKASDRGYTESVFFLAKFLQTLNKACIRMRIDRSHFVATCICFQDKRPMPNRRFLSDFMRKQIHVHS